MSDWRNFQNSNIKLNDCCSKNEHTYVICNFFFKSQNGRRRPFWITKNHFRSHSSSFQINTQLYFAWHFFTKWPPAAILDHRKSLLIAFLTILDQYATFNFFEILSQNGRWQPFWMTKNHFRSHFSPFQINTQLFFFFEFFLQNGQRRPFWMTKNHFRSHFSPFQINMHLFLFLKFWIPMFAKIDRDPPL